MGVDLSPEQKPVSEGDLPQLNSFWKALPVGRCDLGGGLGKRKPFPASFGSHYLQFRVMSDVTVIEILDAFPFSSFLLSAR